MIRRIFRIVLLCLMILAVPALVDFLLSGFFPDVEFLHPLHKCEKNILGFREGQNTSCPLAEGVTGYETFSEEGIGESGTRFVIAADKGLFHSERRSFIFSRSRFAVVLLDNGLTELWVGNDADYQLVLEQARESKECRFVDRFFGRSTKKPRPH